MTQEELKLETEKIANNHGFTVTDFEVWDPENPKDRVSGYLVIENNEDKFDLEMEEIGYTDSQLYFDFERKFEEETEDVGKFSQFLEEDPYGHKPNEDYHKMCDNLEDLDKELTMLWKKYEVDFKKEYFGVEEKPTKPYHSVEEAIEAIYNPKANEIINTIFYNLNDYLSKFGLNLVGVVTGPFNTGIKVKISKHPSPKKFQHEWPPRPQFNASEMVFEFDDIDDFLNNFYSALEKTDWTQFLPEDEKTPEGIEFVEKAYREFLGYVGRSFRMDKLTFKRLHDEIEKKVKDLECLYVDPANTKSTDSIEEDEETLTEVEAIYKQRAAEKVPDILDHFEAWADELGFDLEYNIGDSIDADSEDTKIEVTISKNGFNKIYFEFEDIDDLIDNFHDAVEQINWDELLPNGETDEQKIEEVERFRDYLVESFDTMKSEWDSELDQLFKEVEREIRD